MQVQVNSNHIEGSARLQDWVSSAVTGELDRFEDFLTRLEIHVSDENGAKAGANDKRCQIEARPKGHQSLSVTHKADSLELAVEGAAEKMRHALEHLIGKLDAKVLSTGHLGAATGRHSEGDALLEEEFLAKQDELDNDTTPTS
ncbi:HPF/RaiA family ribosome-associated protein [Pseudomonas sp. PDM14]|uniref:HPF/RaiA family ribosome-associated protein n=1 Tax=Pseudomonas sp. PDM14 TaxID=2769288 RepID=UPI00177BC1A7|nr:HPF/RaiA family ribosome-associated protein [Pseudomonas sp. PDM14]MBD9482234.1 HPF/RaiA family ribosome-associated protein [Pseudomonas sp. PDM14]